MVPPTNQIRGFAGAVHDRRADVADDVHHVLILVLKFRRMETANAEIADPGLGAAIDAQLSHDSTGARAELEAMQRKPELVIEPRVAALGPSTGRSSVVRASMPAQHGRWLRPA